MLLFCQTFQDDVTDFDTRDLSQELPLSVATSAETPATAARPAQKLYRVRLYVKGQPQALIIGYQQTVELGRRSLFGPPPTLDLTDYHAYPLGVSRRHASITLNQEGCWIRDLGSANGTWVNGCRLSSHIPHALNPGDEIWLGKLILYID